MRALVDPAAMRLETCEGTHIFDHLEGWASHLLHLSQGEARDMAVGASAAHRSASHCVVLHRGAKSL